MRRNGVEWKRMRRCAMELSRGEEYGVKWSEVEWSGVEWSGVKWEERSIHRDEEVRRGGKRKMELYGMEWNRMEWNGMEWEGMKRNGVESTYERWRLGCEMWRWKVNKKEERKGIRIVEEQRSEVTKGK